MKFLFTLIALLLLASFASADSVAVPMPGVAQIEYYLDINTYIPLLGRTDFMLADNLLDAQKKADLDQSDSLLLSEKAVLKAIWIEGVYNNEKECDPTNCEIMWAQSHVAINDLAWLTITPSSLNFGDKEIVAAPEPSTLTLAVMALLVLLLTPYITGKRKAV